MTEARVSHGHPHSSGNDLPDLSPPDRVEQDSAKFDYPTRFTQA